MAITPAPAPMNGMAVAPAPSLVLDEAPPVGEDPPVFTAPPVAVTFEVITVVSPLFAVVVTTISLAVAEAVGEKNEVTSSVSVSTSPSSSVLVTIVVYTVELAAGTPIIDVTSSVSVSTSPSSSVLVIVVV